jgi:uncharacterized membrane protein
MLKISDMETNDKQRTPDTWRNQEPTDGDFLRFILEAQKEQTPTAGAASTLAAIGYAAEEFTTVQYLPDLAKAVAGYAEKAGTIEERHTARHAAAALSDVIRMNTAAAFYSDSLAIMAYAASRYEKARDAAAQPSNDRDGFFADQERKITKADEAIKALEEGKHK